MKKYEIALWVLICVMAPIFIGIGVSADILNEWTNNNDWIGFWGSYIGSIMGGLITLYVMKRTIKSNEEILKIDKKQDFIDKIIEEFIEYHVGLSDFLEKISENKLLDYDRIIELTIKSEILHTKLVSRKNNHNYLGSDKMLESLTCVTEKFNSMIEFRNTHSIEEHCNSIYKDIEKELDIFMDNVEKFYSENSIQ